MTPVDDEMLMAYADGELEPEEALRVSEAIAADALLAERYQAHQRLRLRVRTAHGAVLREPVPERLLETARSAAGADVVDLAAHRAARAMPLPQSPTTPRPGPASWVHWGGLAASLAVGVVAGGLLGFGERAKNDFETTPNGLAARGAIADALSTRLASTPAAADAVNLQISYVDQQGHYCRTFTTDRLAGVACRASGEWVVQHLLQTTPEPRTAMRQAASALPPALLESVDRNMAGAALDAAAEQAALARGWER